MIYEVGMLCKHFKGRDLVEKNIYKIMKLNINGNEIDENSITYTGNSILANAKNLVIYSNIFQDNKLFAREYEDISAELSLEKQQIYNQKLRVQPLTGEEITIIETPKFIEEKNKYVLEKFNK